MTTQPAPTTNFSHPSQHADRALPFLQTFISQRRTNCATNSHRSTTLLCIFLLHSNRRWLRLLNGVQRWWGINNDRDRLQAQLTNRRRADTPARAEGCNDQPSLATAKVTDADVVRRAVSRETKLRRTTTAPVQLMSGDTSQEAGTNHGARLLSAPLGCEPLAHASLCQTNSGNTFHEDKFNCRLFSPPRQTLRFRRFSSRSPAGQLVRNY